MTVKSRPKNLLEGGEEKTPSNPEKSNLPLDQFLDQMGVDWERKGRGVYVYPSSLDQVREIAGKIPSPADNEYIIIPLGSTSGYNVFIMISRNGISIRIGYAKNSIPYTSSLLNIIEKVAKVSKEIGIETQKNPKNLLGV